MKKLKIRADAFIMAAAMLIFDRSEIYILYMLSAALHECGHLFAAGVLGIGIKEIRFDVSGVRICTYDDVMSYKEEFVLAISGPLMNLFILSGCVLYFSVAGISLPSAAESCSEFLFKGENTHIGAIGFLALSSILQGSVNLLPIRTFDGGRMAYCMSAPFFGERAAERIIDIFSAFSAFLLWTVALYLMLRISSGLGIYVFSATLFFSTVKANKKEA